MTKKQKKMLVRILLSAALLIALAVCEKTGLFRALDGKWYSFLPYLIPYGIIGYDVLVKAGKNIVHGQIFDEMFLMMIATFGAFAIGENTEAVFVMIFFQIGQLFENYAVGKSRASITEMMEIAPDHANVERDGAIEEVDPEEVLIGDTVVILPGEKIPVDGTVIDGTSMIDTASLTGESVPRSAKPGDDVISGCVNGSGTLKIRVTKAYEDSTVAKILELVENASSRKAKTENFISRFAKYYTPVVTAAAVLLALVPPIFFRADWSEWIRRACTFLVISCPCALVISVPLSFFGGIGAASRIGVLVKGSNFLEALSNVKTFVFDKTGTLTKGEFRVTKILPAADFDFDEAAAEKLLELAAYAESFSTHPIAAAIRAAYENAESLDLSRLSETEEIAGQGIRTLLDGKELLAGNVKLMTEAGISFENPGIREAGTVVYFAYDGAYAGSIVIADTVKDGAKEALADIKEAGVEKTVMLTGDRRETAEAVCAELGIDAFSAETLPADKVAEMERLLQEVGSEGKADRKNLVAFAGDGINDAPVLMRADVGVAMGSLGSDAAIEAADIVLMDDDLSKLAKTVKISKKTLRIVRENIIFALGVKFLVLILGAFGFASMWLAVFADVGVMVIAVLNAMRLLKREKR